MHKFSDFVSKGSSRIKKTVKKADIVCTGGRGVNPSSLIKPKITGFSNHSEMAFGHHNMNANASGLAWLGPHISYFPPILPCTPYNLCMKTPSQIPRPTSQSVPPKFKEF